jgi:hypothetical protein
VAEGQALVGCRPSLASIRTSRALKLARPLYSINHHGSNFLYEWPRNHGSVGHRMKRVVMARAGAGIRDGSKLASRASVFARPNSAAARRGPGGAAEPSQAGRIFLSSDAHSGDK